MYHDLTLRTLARMHRFALYMQRWCLVCMDDATDDENRAYWSDAAQWWQGDAMLRRKQALRRIEGLRNNG